MDKAPSPPRAAGLSPARARPVVVVGVLVVHNGAAWLRECLDALSLQTRPLDRLVIVDTGSLDDSVRIAGRHARIRQVVGDVLAISAPDAKTFGQAVGRAIEQMNDTQSTAERKTAEQKTAERIVSEPASPEVAAAQPAHPGDEWLWLLHDDSAAAPDALAHLLDAARRSPSVGIAGPKLITWDDPSRLLELGSVITRSGRRVGVPEAGEADQGQHDHRSDVLGVSTSGMLIRRDVFETLGGFDRAFGQFCDDLDLCWRAQLAGHRVVVAPRARVREAAASTIGRRSPDLSPEAARRRYRRHGRQVALARCSLYAAPFLAIWIALASLGSAAVLLVAKRPRGARTALSDFGSLMAPWRPMAARWRSRGSRRVRRRDLRGLFASPRAGFGYTLDRIHEGVGPALTGSRPPRPVQAGSGSARSLESGPASEDAEWLEQPARGAAGRILRHPGFLAVMASALLAAVTWRSLLGALIPSGLGVTGGELLPVSGSAAQLWHGWLDGWHGAGLGNALEPAPYLPVLSAGAWVLEHLPVIGASTSPVAVSIAWLLGAAVPLSAWTAYLGARVVTRAPWPRAWAALAWASLATLTTAVAGGRLGAVVAHVLLPLVAAGFACATGRSARISATFGTALALAVLGAFDPALGAIGAVAALVLLVAGHGRTRLRAAVLLLVPIGLLGPWLLRLAHDPLLLLAGPGLTVWQGSAVAPWKLELLNPGGPGSYPALLSAPIVMAGLFALSRRGAGSPMTVLAVLAAAGLAVGMASPHVIIGVTPQGLAGAGAPITGWSGTGLDLAALALIAAALRGFDTASGPLSPDRFHWRHPVIPAVAALAVLGVVASLTVTAWLGLGGPLTRQVPNTPAVAADQARGPLGSRLLVLTSSRDTIGYRLVGAEPGPPVRDLPGALPATDPLLAAAVKSTVGTGEATTSATLARDALADLGVGFVTFVGASTDPLVTQLDATAGMTRLSSYRGGTLWRVLPRANTVGSSRLRLADASGTPLASVAVTGDHGRTEVGIDAATVGGSAAPVKSSGGRRLVVAEPSQWADHARVTFAGRQLTALAGRQQPTYLVPATAGLLRITLTPSRQWWRWGQLGLLVVVLFLAAPFGPTRSGRAP